MTDQEHIASAYDRDLEAVQALIMKMGGMVEHAILESAKALEARDVERAEIVRKGDKAIDAIEEQINEEAARTIALRAQAFFNGVENFIIAHVECFDVVTTKIAQFNLVHRWLPD